jgi:hypothetical protein
VLKLKVRYSFWFVFFFFLFLFSPLERALHVSARNCAFPLNMNSKIRKRI